MSGSTFYCLKLIESIEKNEPEEALKILSKVNNRLDVDLSSPVGSLRVTAVQFAAWRGWTHLLAALKERGADVNVSDKLGRCPLHYAAHQGHAQTVEWLVHHGAALDNPVAINSCARDAFRSTTKKNRDINLAIGKNLPLPECWGRTPLHEAVRNNHPGVVKILVTAGARVDAEDDRGVTPLLLAGSKVDEHDSEELNKFGQVVDTLVWGNVSTNVIHPDTGSSPLHHAATLGSATATRRLLEGGAWPLFQCSSTGSTAMHIAAAAGSLDTLGLLLTAVDSAHIDIQDAVGRTPLHRAAYQGHGECVELIVKHNGNLAAKTKTGVSVIEAIFAHVPRPLNFLKALLDDRVRSVRNLSTEKANCINLDFGILAPAGCQLQMGVVTALIDAASNMKQLGILQHPLVESFLSLKWSRLRGFFFVLVLVHVLFVLSLSGYAIILVRHNEDFTLPRYVLISCSCILLIHNIIQVAMAPRYYLKQFEMWSSLTCAIISLVTSTLAGNRVAPNLQQVDENISKALKPSQWIFQSISIAILFAWIEMMMLIGRFPTYGYYALMFSTVLNNVIKVLLAYVCLIIGFALSFSVLFNGRNEFRDSWKALVKTVVMMMGEYEYSDLFDDEYDSSSELKREGNSTTLMDNNKNLFDATSRIVFLGFVVLASIVLMNLMIGLAVNDIQGLEKEGNIRRLLKQAEFVAHLERVTSHRLFESKWLHWRLRKLVNSRRTIMTKITIDSSETYPRQSQEFPPNLLDVLFSLASKNSNENDAEPDPTNLLGISSNLEKLLNQLLNKKSEECPV